MREALEPPRQPLRVLPDGAGGYGVMDPNTGAKFSLTPHGGGFTMVDETSGRRTQIQPDGLGGWQGLGDGRAWHLRREPTLRDYIRFRDSDSGEIITLQPDGGGGFRLTRELPDPKTYPKGP